MKQFCIIANRDKDEFLEVTKKIQDYLIQNKRGVFLAEQAFKEGYFNYTDAATIPEDTECAIVLGGDGTIIQAAHDLLKREIPILGVNLGTLGFLAEIEPMHVEEALDKLFVDEYLIEEHMMLSVKVDSKKLGSGLCYPKCHNALNDVVITRSGFSRLITVEVYVNGVLVNDYRGDGVIISTPTGSTGYNLSAGGPVVAPGAHLMIITPICPHSLNTRSVVVSSHDTVLVKVRTSKKTQDEEAIVTMDGSSSINLSAEDCIEIKRAARGTKLIKFEKGSFFHVLKHKFGSDAAK